MTTVRQAAQAREMSEAQKAVLAGVMMECGHAAQGVQVLDGKHYPTCVICAGISPGDMRPYTIAKDPPDLTGRVAKCSYSHGRDGRECTSTVPSSPAAAFFEHRPDAEFDRFYCGCWGWD